MPDEIWASHEALSGDPIYRVKRITTSVAVGVIAGIVAYWMTIVAVNWLSPVPTCTMPNGAARSCAGQFADPVSRQLIAIISGSVSAVAGTVISLLFGRFRHHPAPEPGDPA